MVSGCTGRGLGQIRGKISSLKTLSKLKQVVQEVVKSPSLEVFWKSCKHSTQQHGFKLDLAVPGLWPDSDLKALFQTKLFQDKQKICTKDHIIYSSPTQNLPSLFSHCFLCLQRRSLLWTYGKRNFTHQLSTPSLFCTRTMGLRLYLASGQGINPISSLKKQREK